MDFQIRVTDTALAGFEEILDCSWVNFPGTAERFGHALRQIVHTPILIYYRVNQSPDFVEILAIWNGSRREPRIPD